MNLTSLLVRRVRRKLRDETGRTPRRRQSREITAPLQTNRCYSPSSFSRRYSNQPPRAWLLWGESRERRRKRQQGCALGKRRAGWKSALRNKIYGGIRDRAVVISVLGGGERSSHDPSRSFGMTRRLWSTERIVVGHDTIA